MLKNLFDFLFNSNGTVDIDVLTARQQDGRIEYLGLLCDGTYHASFNRFPYKMEEITEERYNFYKNYLKKVELDESYPSEIVEMYYSNDDNGLPNFINKIF